MFYCAQQTSYKKIRALGESSSEVYLLETIHRSQRSRELEVVGALIALISVRALLFQEAWRE